MGKNANNTGSIRKKIVKGKDGVERIYWEGRVTTQNGERRSVTAKTQKECAEKLKELQREVDSGTYVKPAKMTVSQWLDIWLVDYCVNVKPRTLVEYKNTVENHFKPAIGKIQLSDLNTMQVQRMANNMKNKKTGKPLSPKTIKDIIGVLHKALAVAKRLHLIRENAADDIERPKIKATEIKPLDEKQIAKFLTAIEESDYRDLFTVAVFTGMRESELCGLSWDCIDFKRGVITVKQQIQRNTKNNKEFLIVSTKSGKSREIRPANAIMNLLSRRQIEQMNDRTDAGDEWSNENNLVFTKKTGGHYFPHVVYLNFKRIAEKIGCPDARFHDLRHTYATIALSNGDDIKTVQESLGHYAASFTLQVYGHVTEDMQRRSAERMDKFIKAVAAS